MTRNANHVPMARLHLVAQIFNLLYRRIAFGRRLQISVRHRIASTLQVENLRYGRVQLCATSLGLPLRRSDGQAWHRPRMCHD
jgi:hypothetical protein